LQPAWPQIDWAESAVVACPLAVAQVVAKPVGWP
jgi:hypothetical protein